MKVKLRGGPYDNTVVTLTPYQIDLPEVAFESVSQLALHYYAIKPGVFYSRFYVRSVDTSPAPPPAVQQRRRHRRGVKPENLAREGDIVRDYLTDPSTSLRSLGDAYGICHERVRTILRRNRVPMRGRGNIISGQSRERTKMEIENEAKALYEAHVEKHVPVDHQSAWEGLSEFSKNNWRNRALRARQQREAIAAEKDSPTPPQRAKA